MSGWGGGSGGSDPQSSGGWGQPGSGGTDPWGRPTTGPTGGQGSQGWQTQPAPSSTPGAGQPSGWQTQPGGQSYGSRPGTPPGQPSPWGPPPGQQPPPGWGQQPPPGWGRPPQPGQQPPPGWGQQPPPPGWSQPGQPGQVPTWAQPPQGAAPPAWARPQGAAGGPPVPYGQQPPPGAWGQPGWTPAPAGPDPDAFPVRLIYDESAGIGRLWGLLWLGMAVRAILLIPHIIVLYILGIVAGILMLFTWVPVLIQGRQAGVMYTFIGGVMRWATRLYAYSGLLSSGYPPFSLGGEDDYRVRVEIDEDQKVNRFWGIPVIGFAIRLLILIPHFIVLYLLWIVSAILIVFAWIPVLFLGRQSQLIYSVVGGTFRWMLRVYTYLWLLHDKYPPFSLGNEEADRYRG